MGKTASVLFVAFFVLGLFVSAPSVFAGDKVLDPVCGMETTTDTPQSSDYDGKTYYFCSDKCKKVFADDPKKYACFCLPGSDCPHCTGKEGLCPCERNRHTHEHCHGKHRPG